MIKKIDIDNLKPALDLVNNIFTEFVAVEYSEQGQNTFKTYLENKYEEISADLHTGNKKLWGYYKNNEIIGVIGTRDTSHISLMFVDKNYHRQGIARQLFNHVLFELSKNSEIKQITVNSSPYAKKVYERFGFIKIYEKQEKNGIIFIPMKLLI